MAATHEGNGQGDADPYEPAVAILELVAAARDYVRLAVGTEPDETVATLALLDGYAAGARRLFEERPEPLHVVARAFGAYFGEVVRRELGGFWRERPGDVTEWTLCGRLAFFEVNPFGVAYEVLAAGAGHEGPSPELRLAPEDRDIVTTRLEGLGPIEEADFHRFTTRAEVLETAFVALREQMILGGQGDVTFGPEDYEA